MMETKHVVALCTVPNAEEGARIGRAVVEARLAACVNVVDRLRSIYIWQGELCDDPETLLVMKTSQHLVDALAATIAREHPYDVPEVVALPVVGGHGPYLAWIDEVVGADSREPE